MFVALLPNGLKLVKASGTGPGSDTVVGAGASGTVAITVDMPEVSRVVLGAVMNVSGLPTGVVLKGWSISHGSITLSLFNPTGSDVTVTTDSVSVDLLIIGS